MQMKRPQIDSLDELYEAYAGNVFGYLLHLSGDRALADELTGETFYRALLAVDGFRGDASVKTWLLRIARNLYLRQHQRAQRNSSLEALQEQGVVFQEKQRSPETAVLHHEQQHALHRALHQLSEQDRTLLLLVTQEEMAQREVAQILGISVSATKVRLFRARQRLAARTRGHLMIDCHVINDLIFVYVAGEASPQTQELVESHLTTCPDCAKAIERAKLADDLFETWEMPKEKPANGRHFIGRLQQALFIISTLILMVFTFSWAVWHRFVLLEILNAEGIHLQLPIRLVISVTPVQIWLTVAALLLVGGWQWIQYRHPQATPDWYHQAKVGLYVLLGLFAYNLTGVGKMPGILLGGLLLLGFFVLALRWRMQQPPADKWVEWARSAITAVPLLGLILATLNTITGGQVPGIFIAPSLLFIGLAYTYRHLPRLPYLPSITLISLLLANGLLALRAIQAFAALLMNS